jgi:hypothetical protein
MEGMWRKAKKALGIGLCAHLPVVSGDREDCASERRPSDAFSQDSAALALAAAHASAPNTPAQAEAGALLRRSKSGAKSSKVRPFLPLSPAKFLQPFRVKICPLLCARRS